MTQQANVNTTQLHAQGNVLNTASSLPQATASAVPVKRPSRRRAAPPTLQGTPVVKESELAPEDLAYAVRYFAALRRMERKMAACARAAFLDSVESLAEKNPLHQAPRLHLVVGGAK